MKKFSDVSSIGEVKQRSGLSNHVLAFLTSGWSGLDKPRKDYEQFVGNRNLIITGINFVVNWLLFE